MVHLVPKDLEDLIDTFEKTKNPNKHPAYYNIDADAFAELVSNNGFSKSDRDIFIDFFYVIDDRNFGFINIKDALLSYTVLVSSSVTDCFCICLKIIDRNGTNLVDKEDLLHMVKVVNNALYYFGDKYLHVEQVVDFVDSVYTSAGKIDGSLYYPNYTAYMAAHPIVELLMSIQYQGTVKSKMLDRDQIEEAIYKSK